MAGAKITATVDDLEYRKGTAGIVDRSRDLSGPFRDIGEMLLASHEERFNRQIDADGKPWAQLSPEYRKRKKRNQDKVLTLDGFLRRLVYQATPETLEFGSPLIYAATHQFGDTRRGIPARPPIGMTAHDRDEANEILAGHLLPPS